MPPIVLMAGFGLAVAGGVGALFLGLRNKHTQADAARSGGDRHASDPSPHITRWLGRLGIARRIQWRLLQAGLLVRPSELVALTAGMMLVGFALGSMLKGLILGGVLAMAAFALPMGYISYRTGQRRKALINQLAEALQMMASSLRSGYSFMRAMQVVCDEMDAPIAEEFGRVLDELAVGVPHESALAHLLDRCPNGDIELVVTACQIQANVGGNLAEILDTTAEMIRERVRLHGEIAALTAEGRLSAGILAGLPLFLAVVVNHLSPGYLEPLVDTKFGVYLLAASSTALLTGLLIIKKLLSIQI